MNHTIVILKINEKILLNWHWQLVHYVMEFTYNFEQLSFDFSFIFYLMKNEWKKITKIPRI